MNDGQLDIDGQAGGNPVGIVFGGHPAFRFQEDLVADLFRETDDLVFNGRAVAGTGPFDQPTVKGGPVQVGPNQFVGEGLGVGQITGDLGAVNGRGGKGKGQGRLITVLRAEGRKIDGFTLKPGCRPGFKPPQFQSQGF